MGIDWGESHHDVAVMDANGKVLAARKSDRKDSILIAGALRVDRHLHRPTAIAMILLADPSDTACTNNLTLSLRTLDA